MNVEETIISAMKDAAELGDCELILPILPNTILLECGLDSLGYAMLVAQLEENLGVDPFLTMTSYPQTFSEFVQAYEQSLKAS